MRVVRGEYRTRFWVLVEVREAVAMVPNPGRNQSYTVGAAREKE